MATMTKKVVVLNLYVVCTAIWLAIWGFLHVGLKNQDQEGTSTYWSIIFAYIGGVAALQMTYIRFVEDECLRNYWNWFLKILLASSHIILVIGLVWNIYIAKWDLSSKIITIYLIVVGIIYCRYYSIIYCSYRICCRNPGERLKIIFGKSNKDLDHDNDTDNTPEASNTKNAGANKALLDIEG